MWKRKSHCGSGSVCADMLNIQWACTVFNTMYICELRCQYVSVVVVVVKSRHARLPNSNTLRENFWHSTNGKVELNCLNNNRIYFVTTVQCTMSSLQINMPIWICVLCRTCFGLIMLSQRHIFTFCLPCPFFGCALVIAECAQVLVYGYSGQLNEKW